jgi:hypothetical protein
MVLGRRPSSSGARAVVSCFNTCLTRTTVVASRHPLPRCCRRHGDRGKFRSAAVVRGQHDLPNGGHEGSDRRRHAPWWLPSTEPSPQAAGTGRSSALQVRYVPARLRLDIGCRHLQMGCPRVYILRTATWSSTPSLEAVGASRRERGAWRQTAVVAKRRGCCQRRTRRGRRAKTSHRHELWPCRRSAPGCCRLAVWPPAGLPCARTARCRPPGRGVCAAEWRRDPIVGAHSSTWANARSISSWALVNSSLIVWIAARPACIWSGRALYSATRGVRRSCSSFGRSGSRRSSTAWKFPDASSGSTFHAARVLVSVGLSMCERNAARISSPRVFMSWFCRATDRKCP